MLRSILRSFLLTKCRISFVPAANYFLDGVCSCSCQGWRDKSRPWGMALWWFTAGNFTFSALFLLRWARRVQAERERDSCSSHNMSKVCMMELVCCLCLFLLENQSKLFTIKSSVGENKVCIREISCWINFKTPQLVMAWHKANIVFCQQSTVSCVLSTLALILRVVLW